MKYTKRVFLKNGKRTFNAIAEALISEQFTYWNHSTDEQAKMGEEMPNSLKFRILETAYLDAVLPYGKRTFVSKVGDEWSVIYTGATETYTIEFTNKLNK